MKRGGVVKKSSLLLIWSIIIAISFSQASALADQSVTPYTQLHSAERRVVLAQHSLIKAIANLDLYSKALQSAALSESGKLVNESNRWVSSKWTPSPYR